MTPEEEAFKARMEPFRDPNAQPGFFSEHLMLDAHIRIPFLNQWFERRRAEKRVRRMKEHFGDLW